MFNVQPTPDAASYPPYGRPTSSVGLTGWLKGSPEGRVGGVEGVFQGDESILKEPVGNLERRVEVGFEWTRLERGGKRKGRRFGTDETKLTGGLQSILFTTRKRREHDRPSLTRPVWTRLDYEKKHGIWEIEISQAFREHYHEHDDEWDWGRR